MMMVTMFAGRSFLVAAEFRRGDTALDHSVGGNVPPVHTEGAKRTLQFGKGQADIDERAENHVAGCAGETVEVEDLHSTFASRKLNHCPSPSTMWSESSIPIIFPASFKR